METKYFTKKKICRKKEIKENKTKETCMHSLSTNERKNEISESSEYVSIKNELTNFRQQQTTSQKLANTRIIAKEKKRATPKQNNKQQNINTTMF